MTEPPCGEASLTLSTWNLEWAMPGSRRGDRIAPYLDHGGDLLVLTECELRLLPTGHVVTGGDNWGYPAKGQARRKVVLWSKRRWRDVDRVGSPDLPPGRFVAATTESPIGEVRIVGVCVPWSGAHVSTGHQDRRSWEDHSRYLEHFGQILRYQPRPLIVAGDLNQRIPRRRQPAAMADRLAEALEGLEVVTCGPTPHGDLIDHVAVSADLSGSIRAFLPQRDPTGPLTDHTGVTVAVIGRHGHSAR